MFIKDHLLQTIHLPAKNSYIILLKVQQPGDESSKVATMTTLLLKSLKLSRLLIKKDEKLSSTQKEA